MNNQASIFGLFAGVFIFAIKIVSKIFNYLASNDIDTLSDRNLLRGLYNAAYNDEIKYQGYCDQVSKDNLDPEKTQLPL
jgi:tRNA G37 N-methylase Trm5